MLDRRISARHRLHWQIEVDGNDSLGRPFHETGIVEDLSSSGAYFYLNHQVNLGADISLSIRLPVQNDSWIKYHAKVIRVEPGDGKVGVGIKLDARSQKFGVGIRFDSSKPKFVN